MKKILLIGLFFFSGLAVGSETIDLSFNPSKGAKYEYHYEMIQDVKQNILGQNVSLETKTKLKYLMEVKDKTEQETKIEVTYKELEYVISSDIIKMKYDSKKPSKNLTELDEILSKMFNEIIGKSFMIVFMPDGSVKSVTGVDAIGKNMVRAIASDSSQAAQIGAEMSQQFSDASMKEMFEQSWKMYPHNPVKVGDSWNSEMMISMGKMKVVTKTKYTLKETKKNMATVAIESDLEADSAEIVEGKLTGTQTGSMVIDAESGMFVTADMLQKLKGTLETQGVEVQVKMDTKVKISTKKIK